MHACATFLIIDEFILLSKYITQDPVDKSETNEVNDG